VTHTELLLFRDRLIRLRLDELGDAAIARQYDIGKLMDDYPEDEVCPFMDKLLEHAILNINSLNSLVAQHIAEIEIDIRESTVKHVTADNEHWAQHNVRFKTAEYNRDYRQLPTTEDAATLIRSRIGFYTDWRFPGLEIGPGDGAWTDMLVACDPLYLIDHNDECLVTTKSQFSPKYQNRLRCYTNRGEGLHMLPQDQFGFVFSWNTFNYFSFNQIHDYLGDIWDVLRPGGACMFSYNNAERPLCARRAEDLLMTFVPKSMLVGMLEGFGFKQIKTQDVDSTVSWVEFRKPGQLESNRTGQTLGKIILTPHVIA